jgi:hypothetical protein
VSSDNNRNGDVVVAPVRRQGSEFEADQLANFDFSSIPPEYRMTCFQEDLWDESHEASQQAYDKQDKKSGGKTFMSRITKPISKLISKMHTERKSHRE